LSLSDNLMFKKLFPTKLTGIWYDSRIDFNLPFQISESRVTLYNGSLHALKYDEESKSVFTFWRNLEGKLNEIEKIIEWEDGTKWQKNEIFQRHLYDIPEKEVDSYNNLLKEAMPYDNRVILFFQFSSAANILYRSIPIF
jgi:hypothetical protein